MLYVVHFRNKKSTKGGVTGTTAPPPPPPPVSLRPWLPLIPYIKVHFTFGLPVCLRYIQEFVISRFYSMHFTVTLAGT